MLPLKKQDAYYEENLKNRLRESNFSGVFI